jgi:hypothetical protein
MHENIAAQFPSCYEVYEEGEIAEDYLESRSFSTERTIVHDRRHCKRNPQIF